MGGKTSAASINKYIAKAYDRINLTVPKGDKEEIQAFATAHGESVNGFIGRAIAQAMQPVPAGTVPPDKAEAVKAHLELTGETETEFITRAVEIQIDRDKRTLGMGLNPRTGEKPKRSD